MKNRKLKGFVDNIDKLTVKNKNFRRVLYTSKHSQLVVMRLLPGEDIGEEIHSENDQFFRFEEGSGKAVIEGVEHRIKQDWAVVVPAGAKHNIINTSRTKSLRFYTIYSPPHHHDKVVHATKAKALSDDEEFDGATSEKM